MNDYIQEIKSLPLERLEWLLHFWITFPSRFDHHISFTVLLLHEKQQRMEINEN